MKLKLSIYISLFLFVIQTSQASCLNEIEKQVLDPCHISFEEYKNIENCLHLVTKEDLPPMVSNRCLFFFQKFKFVGNNKSETPVFKIAHLNNDPHEKRNCIVLYASYNAPYPEKIYSIISALEEIGFDGHVIYRIGGYPNLENGSLRLIDVPYAFKACAMQEASLLGYQNILWMDSSLTPLKSLKSLFSTIEEQGYFAMNSGSTIMEEVNKGLINMRALLAMNFSYIEESRLAPHITTPIFGLNISSDIGREFLQRFYRMAEERTAFFCDWVDEAPISAILYHMKLKPLGKWNQYMVKEGEYNDVGTEHYFQMSLSRPAGR